MSLLGSSHFRRSTQRDDRRRRLLADDIYGTDGTTVSSVPSSDAAADRPGNYGDGSFLDQQKRPIDLVPRRLTTFVLWFVVGLSLIAGLEFLHNWQCKFSATIPGMSLTAFDLSVTGSLSSWFSSLMLFASALTAILIYTIRRHRSDDYNGRYRIWLWAGICWFLAATDVAANLHEGIKQSMVNLTNAQIWGNGALWWVIPFGLIFTVLGMRMVLDMRPCRSSIAAFIMAGAGYLAAAYMELGIATVGDFKLATMIRSGAAMFGHLMLFISMGLNARFVLLDVKGLAPHRKSKPRIDSKKTEVTNSSANTGGSWTRVDPPANAPQPVSSRPASYAPASPITTKPVLSASSPPSQVNRKLTKQEKKALRERLMRERLERERKFK